MDKTPIPKPAKKVLNTDFDTYILSVASENIVHPFKDWLETRPTWDKTERLETVLETLFTVEEGYKKLAEWAFRSVLTAAVMRTYKPGTKHDEMVILQGAQGIGKSSIFSYLFPEGKEYRDKWFNENLNLNAPDKERVEIILGSVIVECAELVGMGEVRTERLKSFITRTKDKTRLPYQKHPEDFPRGLVFVGTTNERQTLPNEKGGNRRFVPISVSKHKDYKTVRKNGAKVIEWISDNRDQLWAEAIHYYNENKNTKNWSPRLPDDLAGDAARAAEIHRHKDEALEEAFNQILPTLNPAGETLGDIIDKIIAAMDAQKVFQSPTYRNKLDKEVPKLLRAEGWDKKQIRDANAPGGKKIVWYRKEDPES